MMGYYTEFNDVLLRVLLV